MSTTSSDARPRAKDDGLTVKQRSIKIAYAASHIQCNNELHYTMKKVEGKKYPVPQPIPAKKVLTQMTPFKAAKCPCEVEALEQFSRCNTMGTFQSEWVSKTAKSKGVGCLPKDNHQPKRVCPINYRLTKEQLEYLIEAFPEWLVESVSNRGHDHPVSHTSNQIITWEIMDGLPRGTKSKPKVYLDLFGSPSANEEFMRTHEGVVILTYVYNASVSDLLRSKGKWGERLDSDGNERWWTNEHYLRGFDEHEKDRVVKCRGQEYKISDVDGVLCFHSLYYPDPRELLSVLRLCSKGTLTATLHRHEGINGTLMNGELVWHKDQFGRIRQHSALIPGMQYDHQDTEWLFTSNFANCGFPAALSSDYFEETKLVKVVDDDSDSDEATTVVDFVKNPVADTLQCLAWDMTLACKDVYKVTMVAAPARSQLLVPLKEQPAPAAPTVLDTIALNQTVAVEIGKLNLDIPVMRKHTEVFDELRMSMVMQPRTSDRFRSHLQRTLIKCKSVMGKQVDVKSEEVRNIAVASFWTDFKSDAALSKDIASASMGLVRQHELITQGAHLSNPKNALAAVVEAALLITGGKDKTDMARRAAQALSSAVSHQM